MRLLIAIAVAAGRRFCWRGARLRAIVRATSRSSIRRAALGSFCFAAAA